MKKFLFLLVCCFVLILPAWLLAQAETVTWNEDTVQVILLTGAGGLSVAALTELAKRLLKTSGFGAYVVSAVVAAAATGLYLAGAHQFKFLTFTIYTVLVFLSANGIYKMSAKAARGE
jgi:hypothetical protein